MFSKPKKYNNIEIDSMNTPSEDFDFSKHETESQTKVPEDISFMVGGDIFLQSPIDVFWWFNNLSPKNQKIMMKSFVDCLKMDETRINVWNEENNKDVPMEIDLNTETCESSISLPSIVRTAPQPVKLLNTNIGHPNVTERNKNAMEDDNDIHLLRQSSTGIYNEIMDVEYGSTVDVE